MDRGSFAIGQGSGQSWYYGVLIRKGKNTVTLRTMDDEGNPVDVVCDRAHTRVASLANASRKWGRFVASVRRELSTPRYDDAMNHRVSGSYGSGKRR